MQATTCSATKEVKFGHRVSSLQVKSLNGIIEELPTLIECDSIPKDKREIPTSKLAKQYSHLKDIAKEIPPIDTNAEIQLLNRSERTRNYESTSLFVTDHLAHHWHTIFQLVGQFAVINVLNATEVPFTF